MPEVSGTFSNSHVSIHQLKYPANLYKREVKNHETCIHEYESDIVETMMVALDATAPNIHLYNRQPFLDSTVRFKLVDFLLKMLVRLKLLPFVFCRAVRFFDRYCLKRIVLLDQAQLIITTCLWIAAKIHGGNNHFANLTSDSTNCSVRTIADLGFGSGARFRGPTERFRMPKVNELVKLCGKRCNYDASMFNQMEMHIMSALEWRFNDPGIDDFMVHSHEHRIPNNEDTHDNHREFFMMKQFVAYAGCYAYDLVAYSPLQVANAAVDLINKTFSLYEHDVCFQTLNHSILVDETVADVRDIQCHLMQAVVTASPYLMMMFGSRGPQLLRLLLAVNFRETNGLNEIDIGLNETGDGPKKHENVPETGVTFPASAGLQSSLVSESNSVFSEYVPAISKVSPTLCSQNSDFSESKQKSTDPKLPTFLTITRRQFTDLAHPNCHQYPPIHPAAHSAYFSINSSDVSLQSASSKDQIFDHNLLRYSTPMT